MCVERSAVASGRSESSARMSGHAFLSIVKRCRPLAVGLAKSQSENICSERGEDPPRLVCYFLFHLFFLFLSILFLFCGSLVTTTDRPAFISRLLTSAPLCKNYLLPLAVAWFSVFFSRGFDALPCRRFNRQPISVVICAIATSLCYCTFLLYGVHTHSQSRAFPMRAVTPVTSPVSPSRLSSVQKF